MTDPHRLKAAAVASRPVKLEMLEIFEGIDPSTSELIGRRTQPRTLDKGELLFNVGDPSDALYIVADGRVRIWTVSAAGAEVTLNVLTSGAVFGEIGMLDGGVRTAGASAMATTQLISIARRTFFDALDRDRQLARNVIELLCERLRWTSARMEDATLRQAPQRLARILGHLARDHGRETPRGVEVLLKLTQSEMAQWTAMSRESLNKVLNRWSDERLLSQARGSLTVLNLERIDEIAELGE
jgi:CRP-like cAMP-binding protein